MTVAFTQSVLYRLVHSLHSEQIRKEREDYSVAELRVKIQHLEQAMAAEVKRRVDSTHQLHKKAEKLVEETYQKLQERLEEQSGALERRVSELEDKLMRLELLHRQQATKQEKIVEERGQELREQMEALQEELAVEKKARLVREGRFLQQLEGHAQDLADRWKTEKTQREDQIQSLQDTLQSKETERFEKQASWQSQVLQELEALQKDLQQEIQERQQEDDQIVQALHLSTMQLQQSVAIMSGGEYSTDLVPVHNNPNNAITNTSGNLSGNSK